MSNVEVLEHYGWIGDVRERMGASDENDTSKDDKINDLEPNEVVAKWVGWNLGDEMWCYTIIGMYEQIKQAKDEK